MNSEITSLALEKDYIAALDYIGSTSNQGESLQPKFDSSSLNYLGM